MKNTLAQAVKIVGSQSKLARALGLSQPYVWKWLNLQEGKVPAEFCQGVEEATDRRILCSALRPDLFPVCPHTLPSPFSEDPAKEFSEVRTNADRRTGSRIRKGK